MNVFVQQCGAQLSWLQISDEAIRSESYEGSLDDFVAFFKENEVKHNWFFVPTLIDIVSRRINYSEKEKKHIEKAIPFMLEEEVISEIDDLHLLTQKRPQNEIDVLAVEKQKLAEWYYMFESKGVLISNCLPSCSFLPEYDADWLIVFKENEVIIETQTQKLGIDQSLLSSMVSMLTEDFSSLPASIALLDCSKQHSALKYIPSSIHHLINTIDLDYGKLLQAQLPQAKKWNFFKGQFNQKNNWIEKIKPWRWVIVALITLYAMNIGINLFKTARFKSDYFVVKKETEQLFRQVVPRGAIVDPKRQLKKLLKNQETKPNITLSALVKQLMEALGSTKVDLNSFNFDQERKEIKLDFIIEDFSTLENFMAAIEKNNLKAELQNSVQQDEKLKVNLKVGF